MSQNRKTGFNLAEEIDHLKYENRLWELSVALAFKNAVLSTCTRKL
jgi:hypothetical protein